MPAQTYVDLAIRFAPTESHPAVLGSILADTAVAVENFAADRDGVRTRWTATTAEQLASAAAGSDAQLEWFRAFSAAASHDASAAVRVRALLSGDESVDGLALDAEQRWGLWFALAATGHTDETELRTVLESDRTGAGEVQFAAAVAAQPVAAVKDETWAALTGSATLSNERVGALIRGFTAGTSRTLIERVDEQYYALLETLWRERSIEIARRLVNGLFPSAPHTDDADRWLADHPDAPAALRRCVIEQRDHLARALAARSLSERSLPAQA